MFFTYGFLIPLAVILASSLDTKNEYILERYPTNSMGAVPLHSSLNFPRTLAFLGIVQGLECIVCAVFWIGTCVEVVRESLHVSVHVVCLYVIAKTVSVNSSLQSKPYLASTTS